MDSENTNRDEENNFQLSINPQLFFETLLLEIRSKTISFAIAVKKKENVEMKALISEIKVLEINDPESNYDLIKTKQDELKVIREKKLQGTLIRSRARWVEQGEKPTKYFCNLENRNFISKHVSSVVNDRGEELFNDEQIKNEFHLYYQNLYSSKESEIEDVDLNNILNDDTPKLSDQEANSLEGYITLKEAANTLSKMKNNKSPGTSGFTVEFFNLFWLDLEQHLVNSLNYSFDLQELSMTQREGLITCIPKPNKSKKYIKKLETNIFTQCFI